MLTNMLRFLTENHYEAGAIILFGIGFLNLLLQDNLIKKFIGLNIMDTAVYLFLVSQGYIAGHTAPIATVGEKALASKFINPIPSGLVLTGIVVSVSVTAFSLALVQRLYKKYGTLRLDKVLVLLKEDKEDESNP
jgi:multicomponent Na+:H+ antiporter subunit C